MPLDAHLPSLSRLRDFDALTRLRSTTSSIAELEHAESLRRDVRVDIALHNKEVERLEREAQKIQAQILQLQHQKRHVDVHLSLFDHLASPIRKLSDDVLSLIFSFSPPNDLTAWDELDRRDNQLPKEWEIPGHTLERVCCRWRSVARSTPALWSNIRVSLTSDESLQSQEILTTALVRSFLKRSKNSPLDLYVGFVDSEARTQPAWNELLSSRTRWRSLTLAWLINPEDDSDAMTSFEDAFACSFPILDHVELSGLFGARHLFRDTPKLRSIRLGGNDSLDILLPFNQIEFLEVKDGGFRDVTSCLSRFVRARDITIELDPCHDHGTGCYVLPDQCDKLHFDCHTHYQISSKAIDLPPVNALPNLRVLEFWGPWRQDNGTLSHQCEKLIAQCRAPLTSLELYNVNASAKCFLSILSLVPSLKSLIVTEFYWIDEMDKMESEKPLPPALLSPLVVDALQEKRHNSFTFSLVPHLRDLELDLRCRQLSDEQIVDMVVLRALDGLQLFSLHIADRLFKFAQYDRLKG